MINKIIFTFCISSFLFLTLWVGRATAKIFRIKLSIEQLYIKIAFYFLLGFFVLTTLGFVLLITSKFELFTITGIILFVGSSLINLDIINNYKKYLVKENIFKLIVFGVIFLALIIYSYEGLNFGWDAAASWILKAKSFYYENTLPNSLYNNQLLANNVVRDYPVWVSVYYAEPSKYLGYFSELAIKIVQAFVYSLVIVTFIEALFQNIKNKLDKKLAIVITITASIIVFLNPVFFYWMRVGYTDIFFSLFNLLAVYFLYQALFARIYYFVPLLIIGFISILVKNEGITLLISIIAVIVMYLLLNSNKIKLVALKSIRYLPIFIILLPYVIWTVLKHKFQYESGILTGNNFGDHPIIYLQNRAAEFKQMAFINLTDRKIWGLTGWIFLLSLLLNIGYFMYGLWIAFKRKSFEVLLFTGFFVILLCFYILAYLIAPVGLPFYFLVTFDRIILQLLPSTILISVITTCLYTKAK